MNEVARILNGSFFSQALASALLIIVLWILRRMMLKIIERSQMRSIDFRRRAVLHVRSASYALLIVGLSVVWASQLRELAISIVAITLAIVIATKELILCLAGNFYRASSNAFSLGDRIEVDGVRGVVIDLNLMGTTIFEVGPSRHSQQYTGRAIVIPNSKFLNCLLINESYSDLYHIHSIVVPMNNNNEWETAERYLLQAARELVGCYVKEAEEYFSRKARKEGLNMPAVEPRVIVTLPSPERIDLIVRVAVPPGEKGAVEQQILHGYLQLMSKGAGAVV